MKSILYKLLFSIKGMKIGKNINLESKLKIVGKKSNINIGNNVTIMEGVELKTRGLSKIIICDNVKIDRGVRIIAANGATVKIKDGAKIMFNSNINAGANITVGKKSGISAFCMVNSSHHEIIKGKNFMDQGYEHKPIIIDDDVQIGSHSYLMPGIKISKGAMISTHSVVQNNIPSNTIVAGIPARVVGKRKEDS